MIHFFSVAYMTGVIWLVQVVQYPLFALVNEADFKKFHALHSKKIASVVGPMMGVQLFSATLLLQFPPPNVPFYVLYLFMAFSVGVFALTTFGAVPCHNKLSEKYDAQFLRKLLRVNWLRTAAWSLHSVLALWATARFLLLSQSK